MQLRRLGDSDLHITPVGIGTSGLGGKWGRPSDEESVGAIHRALDLGINWIDTAAAYGRDGHSERVIARALRGVRERPYVFTKCGFVWDDEGPARPNLKADSIRRELEASLRRLELEVIDLYQIHWREPDVDIEEAWATLAGLQAEGKIRSIGVSNFDVRQMRRCQAIAPITSLQPPYSLLIRTSLWTSPFVDNAPREAIEAQILPFCREHGIGVIAYSALASGLLSGSLTAERARRFADEDSRARDPDFREPRLSRTLALVEELRSIAMRYGRSVGELAVAWTLANPAVTGAIVGFRRAAQVDELVGAGSFHLAFETLADIDAALANA